MLVQLVRRLGCLLIVLALLAPTALRAQEPQGDQEATARARALFEEGLELADSGDWERAVQRFRRALELREASPVRYNLAASLAEGGRLVEALEELERVLVDAQLDARVREQATALRDGLRSRLGGLVVDVIGDAEGTHVTVDGRPWRAVGRAAPTDPGIRVVRLLREMRQLDIEEADVPSGGVARVTLEATRAADAAVLAGEVATEAPPVNAGSDDAWIWGVVIGIVVAAAGAAVVTGVVLADQGPATTMGDFMPPMLEIGP